MKKQHKIINELPHSQRNEMELIIKPHFATQYNYKLSPVSYEQVKDPVSLTQPGQAMSVREILERFTRGIDPQLTKLGEYTDSDDFDDIDILRTPGTDIVDVENYVNYVEQEKAKHKDVTQSKTAGDITERKDKANTSVKSQSEAEANKLIGEQVLSAKVEQAVQVTDQKNN